MRFINANVLSASDTASHNSAAIDCKDLIWASFLARFGDAGVGGTIKLQASNDEYNDSYNYPQGGFTPTNWADIPNTSQTVTSGANTLIPKTDLGYRWIRVVFTYSAGGTSTINVDMFAMSA